MLISLFIVLLKMKHIKQQPINKLCFCKWNRDMLITSKQLGCIQHGEFLNGNGTHLQKMRKTPWVWPHVSEYLLFYNCVLLWIRSIKVMVRIVQTNRLNYIALPFKLSKRPRAALFWSWKSPCPAAITWKRDKENLPCAQRSRSAIEK